MGAVFSALGVVAGLYGVCQEGDKDEPDVSISNVLPVDYCYFSMAKNHATYVKLQYIFENEAISS